MLPLVLGHRAGWPAVSFGAIAAGVLLGAGFVLVERRIAARGGDPLLNLDVLRAPGLPPGLAALSAAALPAALVMVRGVSRRPAGQLSAPSI